MKEICNDVRATQYDRNPELIGLWRQGHAEAGEELIKLNMPLVHKLAARFVGRGVPKEDLIECGCIGLTKAINTFDLSRGCAFSTYAVPLIFGEMRRFVRDDGIIKVSREQKRLCALLTAEQQRRAQEGLPDTISHLAKAVGISVEDAASAISAAAPVHSLEESAYDDDDSASLGATLFDEEQTERELDHMALRMAIERLDERARALIVLRYFHDLSQVQTARILGLSQVKVSREEKRIIELLRRDFL